MRRGLCVVAAALIFGGCSKPDPGRSGPSAAVVAPPPARAPCAHAACADSFYVDAVPAECSRSAECDVEVKLVATGAFHINDEYPYRFVADGHDGVEFLGKDGDRPNVFSKTTGDWRKDGATTGAMTVRLKTPSPGTRTVDGTFKLSVCSEQSCLLEQRRVATTVVAK